MLLGTTLAAADIAGLPAKLEGFSGPQNAPPTEEQANAPTRSDSATTTPFVVYSYTPDSNVLFVVQVAAPQGMGAFLRQTPNWDDYSDAEILAQWSFLDVLEDGIAGGDYDFYRIREQSTGREGYVPVELTRYVGEGMGNSPTIAPIR